MEETACELTLRGARILVRPLPATEDEAAMALEETSVLCLTLDLHFLPFLVGLRLGE